MQSTGYTQSLAQPNISITMFAPINEAFSAPVFVVSAPLCTLTTITKPITTRLTSSPALACQSDAQSTNNRLSTLIALLVSFAKLRCEIGRSPEFSSVGLYPLASTLAVKTPRPIQEALAGMR